MLIDQISFIVHVLIITNIFFRQIDDLWLLFSYLNLIQHFNFLFFLKPHFKKPIYFLFQNSNKKKWSVQFSWKLNFGC